ncbi:sensor histidine kinase [Pontiella agarivorans]|uniref:Sensor histidine kinase n=1 Tax=Pontiella agarivorans TaxID=3038953 RepID=A0ABU5MW39_9BACT|nr:sensor histidine kinase [Pontiella agarivorans]MDZ8118434.1 sensor histidine kinase [Pontiella agarivorans]
MTVWTVLLLAVLQVFGGPLTRIPDIRALAPEAAAEAKVVDVEAQVVWVDPVRSSFFLNDGEQGIYVCRRVRPSGKTNLKPGDTVRVRGVTGAGGFAAEIIAESVQFLEHRPLSKGRALWPTHLNSPEVDCDWFNMAGRLVSYEVIEESFVIMAEMIRDEQTMYLQIPDTPENRKRMDALMFQWVEFNAVAGTVNNSNRQIVGRIFHVSSASDFKVSGISLKEALSEVKEAVPIHELMRQGMRLHSIVKTYGTVTHVGNRELFLRGERAALYVQIQDPGGVVVGDRVEVVGLVSPHPVSPAMRAHSVRVIGHDDLPEPIRLDSLSNVTDRYNFDLVQMDAKLVESGSSFQLSNGQGNPKKLIKLLCRSGNRFFEADLQTGEGLPESIKAGAVLRLSGLCHVNRETRRAWNLDIQGIRLELRSAADVQLLTAAPWWTVQRLLWVAGIILLIALIFLIWVLLLRKTVERQTGIIGEKMEQEAVLNERQRIARELHDNLEQGLSGAIFRLGGIRFMLQTNMQENQKRFELVDAERTPFEPLHTAWREGAEKIHEDLEAVEHMLSYCSAESRTSILDLRGGLLESMDLVDAADVMIKNLNEQWNAAAELHVAGEPRRFSREAERNVLLVIKEAVSNAIRHANADGIEVMLDYSDGLTVEIHDDGCGFEVETAEQSGRFGLRGMRERMRNTGGILVVHSHPGEGTTVSTTLEMNK